MLGVKLLLQNNCDVVCDRSCERAEPGLEDTTSLTLSDFHCNALVYSPPPRTLSVESHTRSAAKESTVLLISFPQQQLSQQVNTIRARVHQTCVLCACGVCFLYKSAEGQR